jgi:hypothetical protein
MIKGIRSTVFIVGIFLLVAGGLFAQTELRLDTWVSGNLSAGEQRYSVRASQAGTLVVETRGSTDTYLEALDASNNSIAQDDDSGEDYNARLELFVQAGRTYQIVVHDYYGEGPYQIRATQRPVPQPAELRLDTDVSGNLSEGQDQWFRVRASQNGNLTVETMGNLDTFIEAYDDSFNLIDTDDDSGNRYNARLRLSAENGKSYIFKVKTLSEGGPYRIWASHSRAAPVMATGTAVTELRLDTMVSGNLRGGDEYWYSVRPSQAALLTVETNGSLDTYLEAYDSSNNLIASDDDGGEGNNAKIEIVAGAGITYLFKLRGYDSSTSGPYRIWASYMPLPSATELRLDAIVNGSIREGESYWYGVRAAQNGYITVGTMGNTDTFLEAYDSNYRALVSDDDSGGGGNAELEIPVQAGQTYLFKLRGYSSSTSGSYRIWANFNQASAYR